MTHPRNIINRKQRGNIMEQLMEILKKYKNDLSPREHDVVRLAFGLDDGRMRTFGEIGQLFNMSEEEVEKMCDEAVAKMPEFLTTYEQIDKEEWRMLLEKKMANRTNSRVRFWNGKEL